MSAVAIDPDEIELDAKAPSGEFRNLLVVFLERLDGVEDEQEIRALSENFRDVALYDYALAKSKQTPKQVNVGSWGVLVKHARQAVAWAVREGWLTLTDRNAQEAINKAQKGYADEAGRIHKAIAYLPLPSDLENAYHAESRRRSRNRQDERQPLSPEAVDAYLAIAERLMQSSNDWRELAAGILAATGRRFGEIMAVQQFIPATLYSIHVKGALKGSRPEATIPTLVPSHEVCFALDRLRAMPEVRSLQDETVSNISQDRNATQNLICDRHFSAILPRFSAEKSTGSKVSTRYLRYAYAAIAIYWFKPDEQANNRFITEALGHESAVAFMGYQGYYVADSDGREARSGVNRHLLNKPRKAVPRVRTTVRLNVVDKDALKAFGDRFVPDGSQEEVMAAVAKVAQAALLHVPEGAGLDEVIARMMRPEPPPGSPTDATQKIRSSANSGLLKNQSIDYESATWEELIGPYRHHKRAAGERIRRTVEAIKTHNGNQGEAVYRVAITASMVKQISGGSIGTIRAWMEAFPDRWLSHNQAWGLDRIHANRGKDLAAIANGIRALLA